ncbi:MAG TPA: hypothetical protein VIW67_20145, partial [Terriglobales bacterium]
VSHCIASPARRRKSAPSLDMYVVNAHHITRKKYSMWMLLKTKRADDFTPRNLLILLLRIRCDECLFIRTIKTFNFRSVGKSGINNAMQ